MLPKSIRSALFASLSVKTMRHVDAVPRHQAKGLLAKLYTQIDEDFFINGSLTSHSAVPELLAGVWAGGRESILQPDRLDQKTKEAMVASLSRVNDCPYCGDMLISLVHSAGDKEAAKGIFRGDEGELPDSLLQSRLQWVLAVATPGGQWPEQAPFSVAEWPEAIASLLAMSHINRYSHVVMDGSPVPFAESAMKYGALAMFAGELKEVVSRALEPGRSLALLPAGPLPDDMFWAQGNPRIADTMGRWARAIDEYARPALPASIQSLLEASCQQWQGEAMPISRQWAKEKSRHLSAENQAMAELSLVVAMSPWQFSDDLIQALWGLGKSQEDLVRILNFAAFTGARRLAARLGEHYLRKGRIAGAA